MKQKDFIKGWKAVINDNQTSPKKTATLGDDEWVIVHEALNMAYMLGKCQDHRLGDLMNKLLNQL